jgi:hypothetical protein
MARLEPSATSGQDPEYIQLLRQVLDILALIVKGLVSDETAEPRQTQVTNIVNQATGIGSLIASHVTNSATANNEGDETMSDTYIAYQAGAFGPSPQVHGSTFHQTVEQPRLQVDIAQLERELTLLMTELRAQANTPQHFKALAEVSSAEEAVRDGNGNKAIAHVRKAGKWVLDVAVKLGCTLVAEGIKAALGLP